MTSGDPRIRVDADLLFEVDPKSQVFDVVRERINDEVKREYAGYIAVDDLRAAIRTNEVEFEPGVWRVDATVEGEDSDLHVDLVVDASGDAEDTVIEYIEDEVADRFALDTDRLRYKKIRLCSGAWFVDAVYEGD